MGADGFATVQFIPGKFVSTSTDPLYNATAMGTRTVRASWTDPTEVVQTHDVMFTWKNYPFLTISSSFSSTIAKEGDPIYITIKIKGAGAGFQPKPIDIVLAMDRSGSMLEANPDNMVTAKGVASLFASSLTYGKDNIGIVSFGDNSATSGWVNLSPTLVPFWVNRGDCTHYNYWGHCDTWGPGYWASSWNWHNVYGSWYWVADDGSYECGTGCNGHSGSSYDPTAAHQVYLNTNYNNGKPKDYGTTSFASTVLSRGPHSYTEVTDALNTMIVAGGTPTREGIYNAVNQFPADDGKKVRAIVLQTDGVWNTGGDPEGASDALSLGNGVGTGCVITYANNSKVALYVIGLGVGTGTDLEKTLQCYAKNDAGLYYSASDASKLSGIYTDIAGQLNQVAGRSTSAKMDFGAGTISVDGTILGSSADVDKYINYSASPIGGRPLGQSSGTDSTYVYKFHTNVDSSTTDYYKQVRDDTQNWTATTKLLTFDVGKMMLNDTWPTTIKLNLTKSGQLILFPDCHSTVTFIDSSTGVRQDGCIPAGPLSVYESKTNEAFGASTLKVENLGFVAGTNPDPNIWKISWDTTYTGTTVAEEKIEYWNSESGSVPTTYSVISPIHADPASVTRTLEMDTSSWEKGSTYTIKVSATSYDVGSSYAIITKTKALDNGKIFINLK